MISNNIEVKLSANNFENVALARIITAGFLTPLNPSIDELNDIKTAVSEGVTNAIIHGYHSADDTEDKNYVTLKLSHELQKITIEITDHGIGIENIPAAMAPMYTSKADRERSGLGFTVMESFMDTIDVTSALGVGTTIVLTKTLEDTHT